MGQNYDGTSTGNFTLLQWMKCCRDHCQNSRSACCPEKVWSWNEYQKANVGLQGASFFLQVTLAVVVFLLGVFWDKRKRNHEERRESDKRRNELVLKARDLYFKLMRRPISILREELDKKHGKVPGCAYCILLYDLKECIRSNLMHQIKELDLDTPYFRPRTGNDGSEIFSKAFTQKLYVDMNDLTELLLLISKVIMEFHDKDSTAKKTDDKAKVKEIEEFKNIGMKIFFEKLQDFWFNYYLRVCRPNPPERSECIPDITSLTSENDDQYFFLCTKIKIVMKYFNIPVDEGSKLSIIYTQHVINGPLPSGNHIRYIDSG